MHIPKYIANMDFLQDSEKSIVATNGKYDMKNFSNHEIDTILNVIENTRHKYPKRFQGIGLANESWIIKYKPRYILFEIIIQKYSTSINPLDKFAVAMAYSTKGAYFRKDAIKFFEMSKPFVPDFILLEFLSFLPLSVYSTFTKIYESEREYKKAISCVKKARLFGGFGNSYFSEKIEELRKKEEHPPKKYNRKRPEDSIEFEKDVVEATKKIIEKYDLP